MDVTPFPRGNVSTKASGQPDSNQDELFKVKRQRKIEIVPDKSKKGAKRKRDSVITPEVALPGVGLGMTKSSGDNKVIKIETINHSKYLIGCQALGFVLQVNDDALVVSLPGGVTANIPRSEASDMHHRHAEEHKQPIRCVIVSLQEKVGGGSKKKKTIIASARGHLLNRGLTIQHLTTDFPLYGCVASVEDKGYIVQTGIYGITCFLPFASVPNALGTLAVGQPIETLVESVNFGANTVTLRAQRKSVAEAMTRSSKLAFSSLQPGMMVNAVVDKVATNGLTVSFLGIFHGAIDTSSLSRIACGDDWKTLYTEGDIVQARIIFADHTSKSIRLSMRPHVIDLRPPNYLPALGDVLEEYKVSAVFKKLGVFLTLKTPVESDEPVDEAAKPRGKKAQKEAAVVKRRDDEIAVSGIFVHRSSLQASMDDASGRDWEAKIKIGKSLRVRVMGYHLVEGIAVGSNIESFVDGSVVHASQIEVGQVLEVEVLKVASFGLVVMIGGKVRAICPSMHLTDASGTQAVAQLHKRFKPSQKLTMRVWEVKDDAIVMTNKKSIVQAEEKFIIKNMDDIVAGRTAFGIVSKISQFGLQIHFFNKVKGDIPMGVLVKQGVTDVEEAFRIGQVVKCIVLQKTLPTSKQKSAKAKLLLGLDIGDTSSILKDEGNSDEKATATKAADSVDTIETTTDIPIVSGTIISRDADKVEVRLSDGSLGILHSDQICDLASFGEKLSKSSAYAVGQTIDRAIVINSGKTGKTNTVTISTKPLFLAAAGVVSSFDGRFSSRPMETMSIPSKIADLSPGHLVVGYIWKVESYGILVKFRDGMTALAPRPNVADRFISSPVGLFEVGDAVRCVVQRVDLSRDRAIVNLKPLMVPPSSGNASYVLSYVKSAFSATVAASEDVSSLQAALPDWRAYPIGSVIKCTVVSIKNYGTVLMCSDNVTVALSRSTESGKSLEEGDSVSALVLDIDFKSGALDVTLDSGIVSHAQQAQAKADKKPKKKAAAAESDTALVVAGKVMSAGDICESATIVLVKDHYVVAILNSGVVCLVMVADYHCPYQETTPYATGTVISVRVERVLSSKMMAAELSTPFDHVTIGSVYIEESDRVRKQSAKLQKEVEDADAKIHETFSASKSGAEPLVARQKFVESLRVGAVMNWTVQTVSSTELEVLPENHKSIDVNIYATVHVSCAVDSCDGCDDLESNLAKAKKLTSRSGVNKLHPFAAIHVGQKLQARVIQLRHEDVEDDSKIENESAEKNKRIVVILAMLPSVGTNADKSRWRKLVQWKGRDAIKSGVLYAAVVTAIDRAKCTVAISPYISTTIGILDISSDISVATLFQDRCYVGMRLVVAVTSLTASSARHSITISRRVIENVASGSQIADLSKNIKADSVAGYAESGFDKQLKAGDVVHGVLDFRSSARVPRPPALAVMLAHNKTGRICLTEVDDVGHWKVDFSHLNVESQSDGSSVQKDKRGRSNSITSNGSAVDAEPNDEVGGPKHGDIVTCKVLSVSASHPELSMRPSRVNQSSKKKALMVDPVPTVGSVVQGYVANTSLKGCFLRLSSSLTGRVLLKDLSDEFVHSPVAAFPQGMLIDARVMSVNDDDVNNIQIGLSMRSSIVLGATAQRELSKLKEGDSVSGTVHRITDFGVFVSIDGTSLIGLSRKHLAASEKTSDLNEVFDVGDHVKALVMGISGHKISLGLKPSLFDGNESSSDDEGSVSGEGEGDEEEEKEEEDIILVDSEEESDDERDIQAMIREASMGDGEDSNDDEDDEDAEEGSDEEDEDGSEVSDDFGTELPISKKRRAGDVEPISSKPSSKGLSKPALPTTSSSSMFSQPSSAPLTGAVGSLFVDWGSSFAPASSKADADDSDNDMEETNGEDSDDSDRDTGKSKSRKRHADSLREEAEIRKKENAIAAGADEPSSPEDFERLLLSEPNSSQLWIQYMSFYLLAADIDAARRVGLRAIKAISFREEEEKYNVWVALINLEHKYGSMQSLESLFKRAILESKSKYLHLHLAELYEGSNNVDGAREMYEKTLKKHKTSKKVWMAYQSFEQRGKRDKLARTLLNRSMLSLSKHKHVEVILRYASLEFELGNYARGREVFEDLLMSFPKRTDIWNVFVDKEIKFRQFDEARRIFSRMVTLKISSKKIKSIFKKFLNFEVNHGTVDQQEAVKEKARDYVNSLM